MSTDHKFAFLTSEARPLKFLSEIFEIRKAINEFFISENELNINSAINDIYSQLEIATDKESSFLTQIILIIGEHPIDQTIHHNILFHRDVYLDIVYISELEENNDKFLLQTQNTLNEESSRKSYYFKLNKNPSEIFRIMSLLSAHPQQRLVQGEIENCLQKFSNKRRK